MSSDCSAMMLLSPKIYNGTRTCNAVGPEDLTVIRQSLAKYNIGIIRFCTFSPTRIVPVQL